MYSRRRFIEILPVAGLSSLAACGDKSASQPAAPSPVTVPAPAPEPASPPAPAPATASSPTATAAPTPAPVTVATATGSMVDPADSAAAALGYVSNATTTKDSKHVAGAACANCALFGGKVGDASGPCPLYPGKHVASTGWCTGYAKKA